MTKLSVITINYNNKEGLERTIQSVLSQSFRDLEYIVVDGGSADGSTEVIRKYEAQLTRWVSEKDSGIYNAQNKGLSWATGEYCLFLNSGDQLCNKNVLEKVFVRDHKEDIIYGDLMVDWGSGKVSHEKMHARIGLYEMFKDTVWHPAAFIRRDLFEKFGPYDEQFRIVADYEFFFRVIIGKKASTRYLGFPVSVFEFNGLSSLPENKGKERAERELVWKRYMSDDERKAMQERLEKETAQKKNAVLQDPE